MTQTKIALGKWLAEQGVASRRKAVSLIEDGEVTVNGNVVRQPFFRVNGETDTISFRGREIKKSQVKEYYILYKPRGFLASTTTDEQGRPPVTKLIKSKARLYPVGRLDIDSEGLIVLTNDGDLTYRLTHPKFGVKKTYKILVGGKVTEDKIRRLQKGIMLREGRTQPAKALIVGRQQDKTWMKITISEGKYHQVRRMCSQLSLHVERLIRIKEGGIDLGDLEPGEYRKCEAEEVKMLTAEKVVS